jgi:type II secretory pathway component GspD/PulD (secretin)
MRNFLKRVCISALALLLCAHTPVPAEDAAAQLAQAPALAPAVTPAPAGLEEKIALDLRNIDVVDALKFLSLKAGLNIIATKNVAGRITLMVQDVAVKDIFDIMLRSNGLAYVKEGDIYNVMTGEEYRALFGKKFEDIREVKVFRLKYAIPEQAFSLMDSLKSDIGRVLVEPETGTAMIMDTPANIQEIQNALSSLEQKNLVEVFTLKYAKAKDVEEQLKAQLDAKKVGSIKSDERSNQVIIQALPDRMRDVEKLVEALDKKTKEVLIDTQIIKVKLSDQLDSGIEWEGLMKMGNQFGTSYLGSAPFSVLQSSTAGWQSRRAFMDSVAGTTGIGAFPFSGNTASVNSSTKVSPGEKMHLGIIDKKRDFDVLLKFLQTLGKTQILSNPKLAVINNQEAKIHIGERQAYVTTTTTTGQTTSTVSEEVTFVDVGIQLAVTATINDDGYVTMKVKPEISSVVSTLTTPSGNKIPIIDTSMAETTVMIKDGATIIIGGLRKEEKVSSSEGFPILGKIPILGHFLSSKTSKTERTELLVMLTPHIVSGDALDTGDERDFGTSPGKEYKKYPSFIEQPEFKAPQEVKEKEIRPGEAPEQEIKPYREYISLKEEEKEYQPTLKGDQ